jgi:galactokinase
MATCADIKKGMLHSIYPSLYGSIYDEKKLDQRFIHLVETHEKDFGVDNVQLFSTAGRSELGGNHTDHNLGKVLAATINLDTIAAVHKTEEKRVIIQSEGFPIVDVNIEDLTMVEEEKNTTDALIKGIAKAFSDKGIALGGFVANTTTSVLKGSGLSSSAAIEVLCGTIFNHLYHEDGLSPIDLAIIGKYAENVYYGKPSGLMDQIACANGGIVSIDFKDTEKPVVTAIPFDFASHGYALAIVDTKGDHENLTPAYAAIPEEMRSVAALCGETNLRSVDPEQFYTHLPKLRKELGNDRALLRAFHFFNENIRVTKMVESLQNDDMDTYLHLVNESGRSSFCYLQNLYDKPTEQGLSLGLAMTEEILKGKGASRVHGGGFAGTIQAYVPLDLLSTYTEKMSKVFGADAVTVLLIRPSKTTCFCD